MKKLLPLFAVLLAGLYAQSASAVVTGYIPGDSVNYCYRNAGYYGGTDHTCWLGQSGYNRAIVMLNVGGNTNVARCHVETHELARTNTNGTISLNWVLSELPIAQGYANFWSPIFYWSGDRGYSVVLDYYRFAPVNAPSRNGVLRCNDSTWGGSDFRILGIYLVSE